MTTLDDKLLGEKTHYYCSSSSEDEAAEPEEDVKDAAAGRPLPINTANTGPKGVIADWRRFKQLEKENREEKESEKAKLAQKLSLTCRTEREDARAKEEEQKKQEELEELAEDDEFLRDYMQQRMFEMMRQSSNPNKKNFGRVFDLRTDDEFLNAVDNEEKSIAVLILISSNGSRCCRTANSCFRKLASFHPLVKFCSFDQAATASLSQQFKVNGVPAILVYKGGELVARFVRLATDLGEDFAVDDLESFLVEHGILRDRELVPGIIRGRAVGDSSESD